MKLASLSSLILICSITAGCLMTSCKKDGTNVSPNAKDDTVAASLSVSSQVAGGSYDDVLTVAGEASVDNGIESASKPNINGRATVLSETKAILGGNTSGSCAIYVLHSNAGSFPDTVWVNFAAGCTGVSGIHRSGQIQYIFSGRLTTPGTTLSATFTDYKVNGYELEGTFSATNTSTANGLGYSTSVTDGKITYPDASWFTYTGQRTGTQTAGASTPTDLSDDVFSVTGSQTCANSAGNKLTDQTVTPLVRANNCRWIESGTISFDYNNIKGTFNYGNGTCDDQAVITVGIFSELVTLP